MQLKVLNSNQFVSSNLSAVDCECDVEKIFLATQVRQRCYDIIPVVVPSKAKKLFWVIGSHACFANFNFGQILSLKFQYDTVLLNFVFKLSALIFHLTLLMHFYIFLLMNVVKYLQTIKIYLATVQVMLTIILQ